MFAHMEEQMAKMKSMMPPNGSSGQGNFNSFQNLLDSLITEDDKSQTSSNSNYSNQDTNVDRQKNQTPIDILT